MPGADPAPVIDPAEVSHTSSYLGARFTTLVGGGTFLTDANGGTVEVPPDFAQRAQRYQQALDLARQVATLVNAMFLPEFRAFQDMIAPAFGPYPYAAGAPLHEHGVALNALEAFAKAISVGTAAAASAARLAAATDPTAYEAGSLEAAKP